MPLPVIDAHAHIGSFGSWAQVSSTATSLLAEMDQFEVEKAIVFSPDNNLVRDAVKRYGKRLVGYVWPNPHETTAVRVVRQAGQATIKFFFSFSAKARFLAESR